MRKFAQEQIYSLAANIKNAVISATGHHSIFLTH